MSDIQAIQRQPATVAAMSVREITPPVIKPSLHDQIGTGFSQFFRDKGPAAPPQKGHAHKSLSFAERWHKLDGAEKALTAIYGTVVAGAITVATVAGARQPAAFAAKTALTGALKGAGAAAAAGALALPVMEFAFTQGAITSGLRKLTRSH